MKRNIPVHEKYLLNIKEAGEYFNIGIKEMRRIAQEHLDSFAIVHGHRFLIIRPKLEEYIIECLNNGKEGKIL